MNSDMDCPILIRNNDDEPIGNGEMSGYPKVIKLNKNKITIGRSPHVDYCILSQNVSRVHAIIKCGNNGEWSCVDRTSLNGVCINGTKIRAGVPKVMRHGDVIQFGNEVEPINLFTFRVPSLKRGCDDDDGTGEDGSRGFEEVRKRAKQTETNVVKESIHDERLREKIELLEEELERLKKENEEKLQNKERELKSKNAEHEQRLIAFETELTLSKKNFTSALKEMNDTKERMNQLLMAKKRNDVETIAEKSKLESALHSKEEECKELQELINAHEAKVTRSTQMTTDVTAIVANILEAEFQCSVCNDIFVNATTLQCSHTFCTHCIMKWITKKSDCPICRKEVVIFAPTLVLDGFIDKVVDVLSPELKARRLETIAEKNQMSEMFKSEVSAAALVAGTSTSVAGPYRNLTGVQDGARVEGAIEILSGSELSTNDDDDDDSNFSDENSMGDVSSYPYSGPYGNCYMCGERGHWAIACPYR